jgi:hypothetical protein
MSGNHRGSRTYYVCWPRSNNRGRPDTYHGHPKTVYLRERPILEAISQFFGDRVFGPHRRDLFAADFATVDQRACQDRQDLRARLKRQLTAIARRQEALVRQAQDGDPHDPFTQALRGSYNQLESEKTTTLAQLDDLDTADQAEPQPATTADTGLLDALPYLAINLHKAPEPLLRRLFEITQLTIREHDSEEVTITMTLPADNSQQLASIAERLSATTETPSCVDAGRAPGGIRTCAPTSGGRHRFAPDLRVWSAEAFLARSWPADRGPRGHSTTACTRPAGHRASVSAGASSLGPELWTELSPRSWSGSAGHGGVVPSTSHVIEIEDALANLDLERREALVLTQVLGLSYAEAAQICDCPVGTIRSRVFRAGNELLTALSLTEVRSQTGPPSASAP